jgi:hypothetical protein
MAIKIQVSDIVRCTVRGTIANQDGPQPFDFWFLARRLDDAALADKLAERDSLIADFLADIVTGWGGVKGEDGELPFTEGALRELMKIPGISKLMLRAYIEDVGAKAKN